MTAFATFQLPDDATKVRFREPFVSESLNLKSAGIIPPGIYRGFTPSPQPNFLLHLNVDVAALDSVAVVETPQNYNLTARSNVQIVLDMTGQVVFPVLVVLRTEYGITPTPLAGLTSSKVLVVNPTLDNSNPQNLHTGDIKLCRVLGFIGTVPNISVAVPTDRQENGGPLLTQRQGAGALAVHTVPSGSFSSSSGVAVQIPGSTFSFSLDRPSVVAIDIFFFGETVDQTGGDNAISTVFSLQDMNTLVLTDVWETRSSVRADDAGSVSARATLQFTGIKRSVMSLAAGSYTFGVFGRVTDGPGSFTLDNPMSIVVTLLG